MSTKCKIIFPDTLTIQTSVGREHFREVLEENILYK